MIIRTSECIPCTFWFNFNLNKNFSSFVEFHMEINFSLIKLNSLRKIKSQFKENRQKMFLKKSFILSCTKKYKKKKTFGDVWIRSQYLQYTNSVLSSLGHWTELEIEAKLFINTTSLTLCSSFSGITQHSCVVWSSFCSPRCRVKVTLKRTNKIQFACYPKTNPNQLSTFNRTQFTYALFSVLKSFNRNNTLQINSNK